MDKVVESKIRDVVSQFVKDGYMFTVWDITAFLRKNGERIKHSDTKEIVNGMFANSEMASYIRDVVDVNASPNPFLYFSTACDVANYDPDWLVTNPSQNGMKDDATNTTVNPCSGVCSGNCSCGNTNSIPSPIPVPANTIVPATSYAPSCLDPDVKTLTAEGRLNISPIIVSSVGLKAGDKYSVTGDNDSIEIKPDPHFLLNGATVNSDGRIRLAASVLELFFGDAEEFKVEVSNGAIEVFPA